MNLRGYQVAAVKAATSAGRNGILVMPTGSGKSLVIAAIARETQGKTIVLQPTKEILEQNLAKMQAFGETDIGVWSASCNRKDKGRVTFATIGSIIKHKGAFTEYDLVIVDECHCVNSKGGMYEEFLSGLGKPTIGLSATPYRLRHFRDANSEENVAVSTILTRTRPRIFSEILHVTQVQDLYRAGYLCPIEYVVDGSYQSSQILVNSTGQGYDEASLRAYNKEMCTPDKIVEIVAMHGARRCLAFTQFCSESDCVVQGLARRGITAVAVSGETPKATREAVIRDFRAGRIRCVVNVAVLTCGFDFPELDCIILGRPTRSVALYYQQVGRGVRVAPGKANCRLVDLCDNVRRFGKIETFELYDVNGNAMWRLRSSAGDLTGTDIETGRCIEKVAAPKQITVMPWGKYKDMPLSEIPADYLAWGAKTFDSPKWRAVFQTELDLRFPAV